MVTPAHGRPCSQAPGRGKSSKGGEQEEGGRGGRGGEGITAREDHQMELFGMLFNYTCKFEKSLKDEARETGSPFRTASFLISHFFFFWMAHLSQQMLSPDMT